MANDNIIQPEADDSQIVLYQPDDSIRLEVKLEQDTVWLTQAQMTELFRTTRNNITMHIRNIFKEKELDEKSVCKESLHTAADGKRYRTKIYNLDVIISVGYRVKSPIGTRFRQWANAVIKQYLLQGYSVNRHLIALQENMDKRMTHIEDVQAKQQQQLDFFIRTSTPPAEMVFFEGDFYTARVALENLIRTANHRVIIVDGYVSSLTLSVLDVRKPNVAATIYTVGVGQGMQRLMEEHDRLFPNNHIDIRKWSNESHDRWLIIDDSPLSLWSFIKCQWWAQDIRYNPDGNNSRCNPVKSRIATKSPCGPIPHNHFISIHPCGFIPHKKPGEGSDAPPTLKRSG